MKEIMKLIFNSHNFKTVNLSTAQDIDSFYAISEDPHKINYYLVLFVDDLFDAKKGGVNYNDFYEDIMQSEKHYNHQMDKNLSMVICAKRDTLVINEELSQTIYQIEEDPYFFKKYVLTYTEQQVEMIYQEESLTDISIDFFYTILYDHEKFLLFKSEPYKETVYNLVSKLFIKLPFLNLKNIDKQLDNLSANIDVSLNTKQNEMKNRALKYAESLDDKSNNTKGKLLEFLGVDNYEEL